MEEKYINIALKEAYKAKKNNEIPVGCIIVKNNIILAKAHNKVEKRKDATCHAEILAIRKASKKIKNWRLNNCILYTTLEPCMMCCGAIVQSRIRKVVCGTKNINSGYLEHIDIIETKNIENEECKNIIKSFFKNKR